jgi:hypothetical protein
MTAAELHAVIGRLLVESEEICSQSHDPRDTLAALCLSLAVRGVSLPDAGVLELGNRLADLLEESDPESN